MVIGDWENNLTQSPVPSPQSPVPSPQSPPLLSLFCQKFQIDRKICDNFDTKMLRIVTASVIQGNNSYG
ncbi:hypothetical protein [Sphaerospermopsis reniformis]|uniref:hypothetical protein n=1 Tax=Sphaerospermopsis reniformis TaxID=531300 RepID=UPI0010F529FA|nr:hypothetical protein [Sphaerospermopsis reniformis]